MSGKKRGGEKGGLVEPRGEVKRRFKQQRSAPLVSKQPTPDLLANAWTVKQTSHI